MYRKKETEFQYPPVIIKIVEDIVGGGLISRKDLQGEISELPPGVVVVKDEKGLYQVLKTAKMQAAAAANATVYQVEKNHVFKTGDAVTVGGDFAKAANVISAIDKSDVKFDKLTLAGTIGAAAVGDVLVLAKGAAAAGSAVPKYGDKTSELAVTMNKVDLTVANQSSGLLIRGTVNEKTMPYPVDSAIKGRMPLIRFEN